MSGAGPQRMDTQQAVVEGEGPAAMATSRPDRTGQAGKSPAMPSILGPDLTIFGDIESSSPVQIEGRVQGDVLSPSVTVGRDGCIDGSITAENVQINGAVAGWVRGEKVSLGDSGRVDGSIQHQELVTDDGRGGTGAARSLASFLARRIGWRHVRNLSLAVFLLLGVYFVGHSGDLAFVRTLPDFLVPILGDANMVVLLAFGVLVLLGYAWARIDMAEEDRLQRRVLQLERRLAQVRGGGRRGQVEAARLPNQVTALAARLEAIEKRLSEEAASDPAQKPDLKPELAGIEGTDPTSVDREPTANCPQHRLSAQRQAAP